MEQRGGQRKLIYLFITVIGDRRSGNTQLLGSLLVVYYGKPFSLLALFKDCFAIVSFQ